MSDANNYYEQRLTLFKEKEKVLSQQSTKWSQVRLLLFFCGSVFIITAFWDLSQPNLIWLIPSIASFFFLNFAVTRHQKVRRDLAYSQTMIKINQEGIARLNRDWNLLPEKKIENPSVLDQDLNLCGHASLLHLMCRCGTNLGQSQLWSWIQKGIATNKLEERQDSVIECSKSPDWFQELECLGRLSEGKTSSIVALKSWCTKSIQPTPFIFHLLSYILPLILWTVLFGSIFLGWSYTLLFLMMVINTGVSKLQNQGLEDEKLYAGEASIAPLGELFNFLASKPFENEELKNWQAKLNQKEASRAMKDLAKWIHFQDVRRSELMHGIVQTLFLWDSHIDRGMTAWHLKHASKFESWVETLTQMDALISLSGLHYDHPNWCFAELEKTFPHIISEDLGHPLLSESQVVRNDFQLNKDKPLMLVSGSNMAGKSTLLRALGLNQVLAQMAAPVSATLYESPLIDLGTSFRVNDSLADGVSYFMAELQQLKSVVNLAEKLEHEQERQMLFLFDEILLGTNIHDRQIAVRMVIQNLLKLGAWGVISTHDLSLSEVEDVVEKMTGVHFAESFSEENEQVKMDFDYKLKPGLAKTSNALYLVKMVGLSEEKL